MLNVQTLGILLRELRDGNARPDALRAPGAVAGVTRVTAVAADANESVRGDASLRVLPALRQALSSILPDDAEPGTATTRGPSSQPSADVQIGARSNPAAPAGDARVDERPGASAAGDARTPARVASGAPTQSLQAATARGGEASNASAALALSPVGRWLTEIHARSPAALPASSMAPPPLVADAGASVSAFASALRNAIVSSGVFYESHLARWVRDDYPMSALAREPQAGWVNDRVQADLPSSAPPSMHDADKLGVVSRQLDALDTRMVAWSGVPWPGQHASIEIREDEHGAAPDDADTAAPTWRTRITLALPSLGTVEATLALRGDTVELRLAAGDFAGARLAAARGELDAALAGRSLALAAFAIGGQRER